MAKADGPKVKRKSGRTHSHRVPQKFSRRSFGSKFNFTMWVSEDRRCQSITEKRPNTEPQGIQEALATIIR